MRPPAFVPSLLPAVIVLSACSDGPLGETVVAHSLTISIVSSGIGFDQDGYVLAVDDRPAARVYTQHELQIDDLNEPAHTVTLADVAENCVVSGTNPQTIQVPPGARYAAIEFAVTCSLSLEGTIAFTRYQAEEPYGRIAVMQLDASTEILLAPGVDPAWSPDGTRLAFTRERDCPSIWDWPSCVPVGISVVTYPGGEQVDLTSDGSSNPSWSPDGRIILFQRREEVSVLYLTGLYRMNADGTGMSKIDLSPEVQSAWDPAWSPDGSRIAFACAIDGSTDICIANTDGTGVIRLTSDPETEEQPVWSPGGTRIAFRTWDFFSGNPPWIGVVNADGTGRSRLVPGSDPAWAPDGETIVFRAFRQIIPPVWLIGLGIIRADNSDVLILTESSFTMSPAWRPGF